MSAHNQASPRRHQNSQSNASNYVSTPNESLNLKIQTSGQSPRANQELTFAGYFGVKPLIDPNTLNQTQTFQMPKKFVNQVSIGGVDKI